jgi:hypothetical protein
MIDAFGVTRTAYTGSFGYYGFADVRVGQVIILRVAARRYTFTQSIIQLNVMDELTDVDFVSN